MTDRASLRALGALALTSVAVVLSDAARVVDASPVQALRVGAASAALSLLASAAQRAARPPVPPLVAVFRQRRVRKK